MNVLHTKFRGLTLRDISQIIFHICCLRTQIHQDITPLKMQKSLQLFTSAENNNSKVHNYTSCLSVLRFTSCAITFQSCTHCNLPHPKPHVKHKPWHILMFSIRTYFYRMLQLHNTLPAIKLQIFINILNGLTYTFTGSIRNYITCNHIHIAEKFS